MTIGELRLDNSAPSVQANYKDTKKAPDIIDRVYDAGVEGFGYVSDAAGLMKSAVKVASEFEEIPGPVNQVLVACKSFKFIKGMLSLPKLYKSAVSVIKPGDLETKFFAGWGIAKAIKSIVGAVETVFYFLNKLDLISKASLAWTTVAGYIFMPMTFISAGISAYELRGKVKYMNAFRAEIKEAKHAGRRHTPVDVSKRVCEYILTQEKPLRKIKVITENCPLKDRLNDVLARLRDGNFETRMKAAEEGKIIRKRLKDRISEHVGVAGVSTSLSVAGVACTVTSLACPPAAVGLSIAGLALGVVGIANSAYSKFIPQGDIFDTEKRMLFSRVFKTGRVAGSAIKASAGRFQHNVQSVAQKFALRLQNKAAAAA